MFYSFLLSDRDVSILDSLYLYYSKRSCQLLLLLLYFYYLLLLYMNKDSHCVYYVHSSPICTVPSQSHSSNNSSVLIITVLTLSLGLDWFSERELMLRCNVTLKMVVSSLPPPVKVQSSSSDYRVILFSPLLKKNFFFSLFTTLVQCKVQNSTNEQRPIVVSTSLTLLHMKFQFTFPFDGSKDLLTVSRVHIK